MMIKIPRPTDPELRRLWDEARRTIEARDTECVCSRRMETCICAQRLPTRDGDQ